MVKLLGKDALHDSLNEEAEEATDMEAADSDDNDGDKVGLPALVRMLKEASAGEVLIGWAAQVLRRRTREFALSDQLASLENTFPELCRRCCS